MKLEFDKEFLAKFKNIENKINHRIESTFALYKKDVDIINSKINEDLNSEIHQNGLNLYRQTLLDKLIQRRNEQINEINSNLYTFDDVNINETYLKWFYQDLETIKNKNIHYQKPNISYLDLTMIYKIKLRQHFDFYKLNKYASLIRTQREVNLNNFLIKYVFDLATGIKFFSLPSNNIFICALCNNEINPQAHTNLKNRLLVINKQGNVLHSRKLEDEIIEEYLQKFKATSNNLIRFYKSKMEIYDFRLGLLHRLNIQDTFYGLVVNQQNEIAFMELNIFIYKFNLTKIESSMFKLNNTVRLYNHVLVHFNREYFYLLKFKKRAEYDTIYTINRSTGFKSVCRLMSPRRELESILFDDNNSQIIDLDKEDSLIKIYNFNGEFLCLIQIKPEYSSVYLTSMNTIVYDQYVNQQFIRYKEY